jgi:hypothetical protein
MLSKRKRTMILRRLADEPGLSNRALAKQFGIDDKTVASIRRGLGGAEIPHPKPARRERAFKSAVAQPAPVEPERARARTSAVSQPEPVETDPLVDDPVRILREIAADPNAPATARVAACAKLLALRKATAEEKATERVDRVTTRALQIINGGRES